MRRAAKAAAAACAMCLAASAVAYDDDPEADAVFPAWLAAMPASPDRGITGASVFYEIHPGGLHDVELHLRNVSSKPLHFGWWLDGRQLPGDNRRLTLHPFFETREEVRLHAPLRRVGPGLGASRMLLYDVRRGHEDAGAAAASLSGLTPKIAPDEGFLPACAVRDDVLLRRAGLMARTSSTDGGLVVVVRNPSERELHFELDVPAASAHAASRVHVAAGKDVEVAVAAAPSSTPPALLRVFVHDVRVGDDIGRFYAQDKSRDAGWFPLATSDGSAPLPKEKLLSTVEPSSDGTAVVRFRSRLRTPVRFRFAVPGYQTDGRASDVVVVEPGGETSVTATLDRAADAQIAVARVRVFEVSHQDTP